MTLEDSVRHWGWWNTPEWGAYCQAYGSTQGRPVEGDSYVVDLSADPWKQSSKGHRAAIKSQMKTQHIRRSTTVEAFHRAHAQAAGKETRSQETWDHMQYWLDSCKAVCVTNGQGGWAYVICDPPGAYYASAAGKDCHYLQHKIICGLKDAGFDWYELGSGHNPGISTFKAGFSSVVVGEVAERILSGST